jgi:hypothetical protein
VAAGLELAEEPVIVPADVPVVGEDVAEDVVPLVVPVDVPLEVLHAALDVVADEEALWAGVPVPARGTVNFQPWYVVKPNWPESDCAACGVKVTSMVRFWPGSRVTGRDGPETEKGPAVE